MKAKQNALAKPSEPEKVDAYMQGLKHPLADVVLPRRRRSGRSMGSMSLHPSFCKVFPQFSKALISVECSINGAVRVNDDVGGK